MRPPSKALKPPVLPRHLEARTLTTLDGLDALEQCRLDACSLAEQRADHLRFDGVMIVGGSLSATRLGQLSWLDVACERCDLSMIAWPGARLTRVEVRGCRATGASLLEGRLESVRFVDCQLDYASFVDASFHQVTFEACRLKEADFRGANLAGVSFVKCDLERADLGGARLEGADVSASDIDGIRVGAADVRGLAVSREQAVALVKLFGLVVREG
jgi:uncharacterized protein YjbI with pentapeptide repeats